MTNRVPNATREAMLQSTVTSWLTGPWRVLAVDTGYTFSAAHSFLSDVPAGNRIGSVGFNTHTDGAGRGFPNANSLIPSAAGRAVRGLWVYNNTGTESTSRLQAWIDRTTYGAPLSYTTTATGIVVDWGGPLYGVFVLTS